MQNPSHLNCQVSSWSMLSLWDHFNIFNCLPCLAEGRGHAAAAHSRSLEWPPPQNVERRACGDSAGFCKRPSGTCTSSLTSSDLLQNCYSASPMFWKALLVAPPNRFRGNVPNTCRQTCLRMLPKVAGARVAAADDQLPDFVCRIQRSRTCCWLALQPPEDHQPKEQYGFRNWRRVWKNTFSWQHADLEPKRNFACSGKKIENEGLLHVNSKKKSIWSKNFGFWIRRIWF